MLHIGMRHAATLFKHLLKQMIAENKPQKGLDTQKVHNGNYTNFFTYSDFSGGVSASWASRKGHTLANYSQLF